MVRWSRQESDPPRVGRIPGHLHGSNIVSSVYMFRHFILNCCVWGYRPGPLTGDTGLHTDFSQLDTKLELKALLPSLKNATLRVTQPSRVIRELGDAQFTP